jgi:radical SAM/Cys-rich protein
LSFNRLFSITNLPVSRFLEYLTESGNYEAYMRKLAESFNPLAAGLVMCRDTVSVGWDGALYDCDFNQMLGLKLNGENHIRGFNPETLCGRKVVVGQHCFGCTAGAGSSCGGEVIG